MVILLNENDLIWIKNFKNNIIPSIQNETFHTIVINEIFNTKNLLPENIHYLINEFKNYRLNESIDTNKGLEYVSKALGVSKNVAIGMLQNPKNAARTFRAIREKLEECEDIENRARAEKKGFLATIIYTLKKALYWMINTFQDLKDYVLDSAIDSRQEGAAQAKRDFKWINKYNEKYMDRTFQWYNDADKTTPRDNRSSEYIHTRFHDKLYNRITDNL